MQQYVKVNLKNSDKQEFTEDSISDFSKVLLRIESTNNCNFKCSFCPHPKMKRTKGFMDDLLYYSVINQASDLGFKMLDLRNFGEPILDKRLGDFASHANKKGLDRIYIHTNGYGLTEKILNKWGEGGITDVNISLSPKREFGLSRPGVNVDRMFSGIEKVMNSNSPWKHILSVDYIKTNESTEEEQTEFINWLDKLKLPKRIDIDLHNWAEGGVVSSYSQCHRLWTSFTVLWDGKVSLCCLDYEGDVIIGDLKEQSLKHVINCEKYKEIRSNHIKGLFLEKCSNCDMVQRKDFGAAPSFSKISQ